MSAFIESNSFNNAYNLQLECTMLFFNKHYTMGGTNQPSVYAKQVAVTTANRYPQPLVSHFPVPTNF
jgi:hypothetical protein